MKKQLLLFITSLCFFSCTQNPKDNIGTLVIGVKFPDVKESEKPKENKNLQTKTSDKKLENGILDIYIE